MKYAKWKRQLANRSFKGKWQMTNKQEGQQPIEFAELAKQRAR